MLCSVCQIPNRGACLSGRCSTVTTGGLSAWSLLPQVTEHGLPIRLPWAVPYLKPGKVGKDGHSGGASTLCCSGGRRLSEERLQLASARISVVLYQLGLY